MVIWQAKVVLIIMAGLFIFSPGGKNAADFESKVQSIARPYRFSILQWEIATLAKETREFLSANLKPAGDVDVRQYFGASDRIRRIRVNTEAINAGSRQGDSAGLARELAGLEDENAVLSGAVIQTLGRQIRETLSAEGIFTPFWNPPGFRISFPPLKFRLEDPPYLLVVSPRDRIESIKEVTLKPGLDPAKMAEIEDSVDGLGVSSLVLPLGGFAGTYPSLVSTEGDLRFTLHAAVEEWLHQYLAFKPLGFRYLLDRIGIARSHEIATMNETIVGIVSREISDEIMRRYYGESGRENTRQEKDPSGFDFDREMRQIRKTVDLYLAQGEVDRAEKYMEEQRQNLAAHGYYIRKLNQAYFAFHGSYADRPASISPIGSEVRALRAQSGSLREFLETAAALTSRQDLQNRLR